MDIYSRSRGGSVEARKKNRRYNKLTWPQNVGNTISEDINFNCFFERGRRRTLPKGITNDSPYLEASSLWPQSMATVVKLIHKSIRGCNETFRGEVHASEFFISIN